MNALVLGLVLALAGPAAGDLSEPVCSGGRPAAVDAFIELQGAVDKTWAEAGSTIVGVKRADVEGLTERMIGVGAVNKEARGEVGAIVAGVGNSVVVLMFDERRCLGGMGGMPLALWYLLTEGLELDVLYDPGEKENSQ